MGVMVGAQLLEGPRHQTRRRALRLATFTLSEHALSLAPRALLFGVRVGLDLSATAFRQLPLDCDGGEPGRRALTHA
jgi:hypothetical protein